jgi:hypothetical protein
VDLDEEARSGEIFDIRFCFAENTDQFRRGLLSCSEELFADDIPRIFLFEARSTPGCTDEDGSALESLALTIDDNETQLVEISAGKEARDTSRVEAVEGEVCRRQTAPFDDMNQLSTRPFDSANIDLPAGIFWGNGLPFDGGDELERAGKGTRAPWHIEGAYPRATRTSRHPLAFDEERGAPGG